jgi:N-acetylmuramoyl-L-alanine amidase
MRWSKPLQSIIAVIVLLGCALVLSPAESEDQTQSPPAQQPSSPAPPPQPAQTQAESQPKAPPVPFVMIDPSHGGTDEGAVLGNKVLEKDVTLGFARQLRAELENRGIAVRLMRDTDTSMSLEQRAEAANGQHTAIYLAVHAGRPGQGVRIYTTALISGSSSPAGKFLSWENAQSSYLNRSKALAEAIAAEMNKRNVKAPVLSTPLRPLNNVAAPAVAVELAADLDHMQEVLGPQFQNAVAADVAAAVAHTMTHPGAQP